jgi:hypothetical protein
MRGVFGGGGLIRLIRLYFDIHRSYTIQMSAKKVAYIIRKGM